MKMKSVTSILVVLLGFNLSSCKESTNNIDLKKSQETILDKNLVKSSNKYTDLIKKRAVQKDRFTIEDIKRDGNTLSISVKGGCEEKDFNIVWDGLLRFIYPAQINLVLFNNDESNCEINKEFTITVNLSKVLGEHDPKNFIFNIANGSFQQDKTINQNGTVTTR